MAARRLGYQKETCGKCGLFSWNLIDLIGFIIKLYSLIVIIATVLKQY